MANVKATDLIDFTRASKGHALAKVSYGSEQLSNTDFSVTTPWYFLGNASISNGVLVFTTNAGDFAVYPNAIEQTVKAYKLTYEVLTSNDGNLRLSGGSSAFGQVYIPSSVGSHTVFLISNGTQDNLQFNGNGFAGTIDNVSLKEAYVDNQNGTLQLFEHPNNIPRIEYDADGNLLGLLIEEARTNLFTHSEEIDSGLTTRNGLVTPSDIVINEGVYQGTWRNFTEDTSNGQHRLLGGSTAILANTVYSVSFLVKRTSGSRNVQVLAYNGGDSLISIFDLDAETAIISNGGTGSAESGSVENLGSGVYKVSVSGKISTTATTTSFIIRLVDGASGSYAGDGTSSLAIKGMQFEAGSFPTSYIKTQGSAVSRAADVASIDVDQFGYNQSEGTLFASYHAFSGQGSTTRIAALNDGSTSNSIQMALLDAGTTYHEVRSAGTAVVTTVLAGAITDDALTKTALASSLNDHAGTTNGGTVGTDTSGAMPIGITTLNIGSHYSGNFPFNGHIKSLTYTPKRLSNAKLQELTS